MPLTTYTTQTQHKVIKEQKDARIHYTILKHQPHTTTPEPPHQPQHQGQPVWFRDDRGPPKTHHTGVASGPNSMPHTTTPATHHHDTFHTPQHTKGSTRRDNKPPRDSSTSSSTKILEQPPLRTPAAAPGGPPTHHPHTQHGQRRSETLLRKEVIQPHLPVRLPCYDFVPIASPTFDHSIPKRGSAMGFGCYRLS
jgi:hypothetical protein